LCCNNKPTRCTALIQTARTPDSIIARLSEDAHNTARFYLLSQAGVKPVSKSLVSSLPDGNVMYEASKAIGEAVRQCR